MERLPGSMPPPQSPQRQQGPQGPAHGYSEGDVKLIFSGLGKQADLVFRNSPDLRVAFLNALHNDNFVFTRTPAAIFFLRKAFESFCAGNIPQAVRQKRDDSLKKASPTVPSQARAPRGSSPLTVAIFANDGPQIKRLVNANPDVLLQRNWVADSGPMLYLAPSASGAFLDGDHGVIPGGYPTFIAKAIPLHEPQNSHAGASALNLAVERDPQATGALPTLCACISHLQQNPPDGMPPDEVEKLRDAFNQVDGRGHTPLALAVELDHAACVDVLLQQGAEINRANGRQRTPLMMAAWACNVEMVDRLLAANADVLFFGARDRTDPSALSLAVLNRSAANDHRNDLVVMKLLEAASQSLDKVLASGASRADIKNAVFNVIMDLARMLDHPAPMAKAAALGSLRDLLDRAPEVLEGLFANKDKGGLDLAAKFCGEVCCSPEDLAFRLYRADRDLAIRTLDRMIAFSRDLWQSGEECSFYLAPASMAAINRFCQASKGQDLLDLLRKLGAEIAAGGHDPGVIDSLQAGIAYVCARIEECVSIVHNMAECYAAYGETLAGLAALQALPAFNDRSTAAAVRNTIDRHMTYAKVLRGRLEVGGASLSHVLARGGASPQDIKRAVFGVIANFAPMLDNPDPVARNWALGPLRELLDLAPGILSGLFEHDDTERSDLAQELFTAVGANAHDVIGRLYRADRQLAFRMLDQIVAFAASLWKLNKEGDANAFAACGLAISQVCEAAEGQDFSDLLHRLRIEILAGGHPLVIEAVQDGIASTCKRMQESVGDMTAPAVEKAQAALAALQALPAGLREDIAQMVPETVALLTERAKALGV